MPNEPRKWAFTGLCWAVCAVAVLALVGGWRAVYALAVLAPVCVLLALAAGGVRFVLKPCPDCRSRWTACGPQPDRPRTDMLGRPEPVPYWCCRCGRKQWTRWPA